jgi:hypothetical protein
MVPLVKRTLQNNNKWQRKKEKKIGRGWYCKKLCAMLRELGKYVASILFPNRNSFNGTIFVTDTLKLLNQNCLYTISKDSENFVTNNQGAGL